MKIHVGCGKRNFGDDWIHVDGAYYPHIKHGDFYLDHHPKDDIDLIYACHFLEYFDREEAMHLLKRWHFILKPGGILRLAVPDWDNMILALTYNKFKLKDILGPLYGRMMMRDQLIYHKTVYTFSDLKEVLKVAGFKTIRRYDWRDTDHAEFDDQSQAYLPKMDKEHGILISLNVEAVK